MGTGFLELPIWEAAPSHITESALVLFDWKLFFAITFSSSLCLCSAPTDGYYFVLLFNSVSTALGYNYLSSLLLQARWILRLLIKPFKKIFKMISNLHSQFFMTICPVVFVRYSSKQNPSFIFITIKETCKIIETKFTWRKFTFSIWRVDSMESWKRWKKEEGFDNDF